MQPKFDKNQFLKSLFYILVTMVGSKKPSQATVPLTHYTWRCACCSVSVPSWDSNLNLKKGALETVPLTHYTWLCACCSGSVPSAPPLWRSGARSAGRRRCGPARGQNPPALTSPRSEAATASSQALKDFLRLIISWRKWNFRHWYLGGRRFTPPAPPPQIYPHP